MPHPIPRCQILPLPGSQFSFQIGGHEVTRWWFSTDESKPFFYPISSKSGLSLTRMGHPGAPNHDHHRSFWFAHSDVMGQDFWSINKQPRITQTQWYAIEDQDDYARIALELHWTDGHDPRPLVRQDMFATLRPVSQHAWTLELQNDFRSTGEGVAFRKSNFGIVGLRVAKNLSVVFGGGQITGSDGGINEPPLFGKANRWLDYSGPTTRNVETNEWQHEGMALIDHRSNPQHPVKWHVRDDGWIGPSLSRDADISIPSQEPLTVRYMLFVHDGRVDPATVNRLADEFDARPLLKVVKGTKAHHQWSIL